MTKNNYFCSLALLLLHCFSFANIVSTSGEIKFDSNSSGDAELILNSTGLGLGKEASTKIDVAGNAIIEEQLNVGGSGGSSDFNVHGSYALAPITISANARLDDSSMVLVGSLSDNITLTMPYAANVIGRVYYIKKITSDYSVWLGGGGNLIDDVDTIELIEKASVKLLSNGQQWFMLKSQSTSLSVASGNLEAWWKFDESSGEAVADATNNGFVGTLNEGLSFTINSTTGVVGRGLELDGVDDYVSFGSEGGDLIEGEAFSVSLWFKLNDTISNLDGIISKDSTGGPFSFSIRFSGINLQFMVNNNGLTSSFSPAQDEWYHLVINFDTTNGRSMFINGTLIASDTYTTKVASNDDELFIGFDHNIANTRHPAMSVDDVKIYNRPLTESELNAIYQNGQ